MQVTTSAVIARSREALWRGITDATMTLPRPWWFRVGIPTPQRCEIIQWEHGQGTLRRCTADRGTITQRITRFEPPGVLAFTMATATLEMPGIRSLSDRFDLVDLGGGRTRITRVTRCELDRTGCACATRLRYAIGLKAVHRFVYRNLRRADAGTAA